MVDQNQEMNQGHDDLSDDDRSQGEAVVVVLKDEEGRSLPCYVDRSLTSGGVEYLLLFPVDHPVEIFAWEVDEENEEEEVLVDIDEEEIDDIFQTARAVLAEQDLILNYTAHTLTASGELPEADEEDVITLELDEDEEALEQEEFQLLANFYHEEQEYAIYTPRLPLLFFARVNEWGEPEVVPPDELQLIRSQLEDQLFEDAN